MVEQTDIDKILDAADIVSVIGQYVNLHKRGANYFGCCPFHDEKTASMSVSTAKNMFKCFGCGKSGNVISFVADIEGINYGEAARVLAKKYGIDIKEKELTSEELARQKERESLYSALDSAQKFFENRLHTDTEAISYLKSRCISDDTIRDYMAGYSGQNFEMSANLSSVYSPDVLKKADLIKIGQHNNMLDTFRDRITFPFLDNYGRIVGFTGRGITDNAINFAKYLNTSETPLFHKGEELFGLYQARNEITRSNKVYMVEGQFDVLSFHQNGIKNVVCGSSTAFTEQQRKKLLRLTQNITLIYDNDAAGVAGAIKHIPELVASGFAVRAVALPDKMDPDDFAKSKGGELVYWIEKNEKSFVEYLYNKIYKDVADEVEREKGLQTIISAIAKETTQSLRNSYISSLAKLTKIGTDILMPKIKTFMHKDKSRPIETVINGFAGLEDAKQYLDEEHDSIILTSSWPDFESKYEQEPIVYFSGLPTESDIQQLRHICNNVKITEPDTDLNEKYENNEILLLKQMFAMNILIEIQDMDEDENETVVGFITWYVNLYVRKINTDSPTNDITDIYLSRLAEMIADAPQTTRIRCTKDWAKALNITEKSLKDIVKPFLDAKKSKKKITQERDDFSDDMMDIDAEKIPDYVLNDETYSRMNSRYEFYPMLSKSGTPICYMFKNPGGSYSRVCDFYMEPLLHVYDKDPELNKRVLKLNSIHRKKPIYVEWKSSTFANMAIFKTQLVLEGDYNFENGTVKHFDKIWTWMSHEFRRCVELRVFGQQREDFFAWSNAIFHKNEQGEYEVKKVDNLGIVEHDGELYYSPAFSEMYAGERQDNDKYEQDKWLVYTDVPENKQITFAEWADLFCKVYKINSNGAWGVIYAIMCAFRSDIWPISRLFTAIFFVGQTSSGKSQIAVSIRSLFEKPDAPAAKLESVSDAAFFSLLERFRDVPCIFDEYNDEEINDVKFQGLKACTYDGDGKQKRKSATGNDISVSKVNAPIILLGQEAPQRDDNALSNRLVLCEVPAYNYMDDKEAQQIFRKLKQHERDGLSYLLAEVLKLRPIFRAHFEEIQKQCTREIMDKIDKMQGRSGDQNRIIITISMFTATCKIMEEYAPNLRLPFTYNEFIELGMQKIKQQVEMIARSDKLASFFNTIDYLIDKGTLKFGRDIKIEQPTKLKLKGGEEVIMKPSDSRVLYMNISNVHKMYLMAMTGEKPLTLTTLEVNLKSHPSYIGTVSNTRFRWQEVREVPRGETSDANVYNNELKRIVENKEKQTSAIVLNYDILQKFMGIDFERLGANSQSSTPVTQKPISEQTLHHIDVPEEDKDKPF
jgi:DNA primase catalytic core